MKRLVAGTLIISLAFIANAEDIQKRLTALVSESTAAALVQDGFVRKTAYRENVTSLPLLPRLLLADEADRYWGGDTAPFVSETLFLHKKSEENESDKDGVSVISTILRSLSRLEGIEYYSNSRKAMRTLYRKSYVVESEDNRIKREDPKDGSADGVSLVAIQEDLTFGEYAYQYTYRQTDDTVAFYSKNIDSLYYGIFRIIRSGNLRIALVIHDLGDYLLVYNLTRADFLAVPGMEKKLNASFSSRADAVYAWFIDEYEKNRSTSQ